VAAKLVGAKVASVFVDDGDLSTVSSRSLLGDLVTEAHGRSVAGASPAQGPFPLQRLRQLDPDFYLATAGSGRTLKQLRSQAGTRGLRAVKAGHFAVLPPEASVAGPAVGTALVEIARILHP
jgi:ABC-type Fe3+-hydroxamate transport system substrate-binding protein